MIKVKLLLWSVVAAGIAVFAYTRTVSNFGEKVECGTVIEKSVRGYVTGRHSGNYHEKHIIVMRFSDRYEEVDVPDDTYYGAKIGSRMCFWMQDMSIGAGLAQVTMIVAVMCMSVLLIIKQSEM